MTGSTLARRALGRELKRMRDAKGLNQSAAGRVIGVSPQTIGRMEDGLPTKVSDLYINALCDAYSAVGQERSMLLDLAREVRATQKAGGGWWRAYADEMNAGFDHYLGLEAAAQHISIWKLAIVPGLLQTVAYRRAMAWAEFPAMPSEQIEKLVGMAVRRQERLVEADFTVDVILSEMVLRDEVGGRAVMAEQLRTLAVQAQRPNITVRCVPFDAQGHLGSRVGSFVLLEFPQLPATGLREPPVVYVEEFAGDLYLEREAEVRRYRDALSEISRVALDPDTTRQLVLSIAEEYST
ncbi:helix-turn-helix domain-containing protein [Nocardia huaxiensis]|uniref:helix-turn-helix domain-containing protein n=1 Tax=Nocardia huaxiensis TaxID=2755382 RepID=UPI001E4D7F83|nr:helix-turn-helix transcriptional regulator [Nocardia huaxiensis]UFS99590.1 helix-turn-helix domain-containing protein [Nocardia huaxiensis]